MPSLRLLSAVALLTGSCSAAYTLGREYRGANFLDGFEFRTACCFQRPMGMKIGSSALADEIL